MPDERKITPSLEPLLTTPEVAGLLRVSQSAVNKWRVQGTGPVFIRTGTAVRYRPADVASFVTARTRTSTSEREAKKRKEPPSG